jgi:hypothetical protein
MDRLKRYRELVKQVMQNHADLLNSQPVPGEEVDCVFDEHRDQYLLLKYGLPRGKHAHYTKIHIRITDGKIWIKADMTEDGVANELVEAGVPKEDVVLAFNPPELRSICDYAIT